METQTSTIIGLNEIEVSTTNRFFRRPNEITPEALGELANSIAQHGVLQAVRVRKHPTINGKYELIYGERRFRASALAGKQDIPAYVMEADDDLALELQAIENLQREDPHPLNEAIGYKVMLERKEGMTTAELALRFGTSETYVLQRLKLNDLVREAKKDFLDDLMLLGHAIILARLTPADQRQTREQLFRRKNGYGTVSELQDFVEREVMNSLSSAPFDKNDESLYKKAGACVNCPKRSGASPMLFAEIKEKDKCFDRACFFTKCHKHLLNRTKEIVETKPEIVFLTDYNAPNEEVATILTENRLKPLSEYSDFSQHKTGGSKAKGLWISGSKAGQMATVFLKKEESVKTNDVKESTQLQIDKIKQRMERAKELDREKVYAKILEALRQHPSQKKSFDKKLMPDEEVMLWFVIYDKAGYHLKNEFNKVGISRDNPDKFYERLSKLKPEEKAFLLRRVMLDQYGGKYPDTVQGAIIYRIASGYRDIDIKSFEMEQAEICQRRETRAKGKIKELQRIKSA